MALCNKCRFFTEAYDELNRDFNDIGDPDNHYCPMYQDAIPNEIYYSGKNCEYFTDTKNEQGS